MKGTSQIVSGGGWKDTNVETIKVKAWFMLFSAIILGAVALDAVDSDAFLVYACAPAVISLFLSVMFFIREKPRAIGFPHRRVGEDLRKLYGASGQRKPR